MIRKLAIFSIGNRVFCLPIERILHIIPTPRVFHMPLLPQGVSGIILFQQEVAPFIDLASRWGLSGGGQVKPGGYTVIYGSDAGVIGLPVEQVLHIVDQDQGKVEKSQNDDQRAIMAADFDFVFRKVRYPMVDVELLISTAPPESNHPATP